MAALLSYFSPGECHTTTLAHHGARLVGTVQCRSYPATSRKENIALFESAGDVASAFVPQSREGGRRHAPSTP